MQRRQHANFIRAGSMKRINFICYSEADSSIM